MIDKLTYEQVIAYAKDMREEALIIEDMARSRGIQDLVDFSDKDADKALADLVSKK